MIEAQTLGNKEGKIVLLGSADGGGVQVVGTLDASAPGGGSGGFVETSGAHVQVADSAKVTTASANGATGNWLIDPSDFTIAASGGDMTGAAVSAAVQSNNFQVQTASSGTGNGDLFVNDALSWTSANTLTLTAGRTININAAISASSGGLNLSAASAISASGAVNVGTFTLASGAWSQLASALPAFSATDFRLSGGSFLRALGGDGSSATPWRLTDSYGLQGMGTELAGHFSLANAINASGTANWNCTSGVCAGFAPIGSSSSSNFTGSLDGQGYTISGLLINRSTQDYDGLFGYTGSGSTLSNIALVGGSVTGHYRVGGLVGYNQSNLSNVSTTGAVSSATSSAGGLVGYNKAGSISNAHATGTVASASYAGGLVGYNYTGTINNAYATGATSGASDIGGLAGRSESGSLTNVYATGNVTGSTYVGGLVGANTLDTINHAYATGAVAASSQDGGLVGNDYMSSITNAFYATTLKNGQTINAGLDTNSLGIGKTWADLSQSSTFTGWNISTTGGSSAVWRIYNGATTPLLSNFLTPVTVGASINSTYNGNTSGNFTYTTSVPGAVLNGTAAYTSTSANAGTYTTAGSSLTLGGLYSGQQGYDITYGNASLVIGQAPLMITANDASKTYDGIAYSGGNGVTYSGLVNNENSSVLTGSLAYGGSSQGAVNHGTYGISVNGLTSSNYAITFANGSLAIGQAPLTITANDANKTYDGIAYSGGNGVTYSGLVNNENASVLTGTLAYGGSAQGAVNEGTYTISASGLSADNYAVAFVDGALGISGQPAPPSIPPITPVTPPTLPTAPTAPTLPTEPTAPAEVQVSTPASYVNALASLHTGQPDESGGEVPVIGDHVGESIRAMGPATSSDENGDQGIAPGEHSYKVIASGIRLPEGL